MTKQAKQAADLIQQRAPNFTAEIGLILGSGLGVLAEQLDNAIKIPYQDLPGFPHCAVSGHSGVLHLGSLHGRQVACLEGRAHFYEGISNDEAKTLVRTLKLLGCSTLLATNSAGSLHEEVMPGSLVVIRDHINFQFTNPLVGNNDDDFGPRFIGMENAYDADLRANLIQTAKANHLELFEGVYIAVLGPSFETPAEIQAFRQLGADVVGMSTINEVITARHCGMKVLVVSVITNLAAGMSKETLTHEGTLQGAKLGSQKLIALISNFIQQWQTHEILS